jgi:glycosyltransferase involved in cell wall biosynthesis
MSSQQSGRAPISAIITTYNDANFLADALASVAAQTVRPAQVLVVDDGSDGDAAASITAQAAERHGLTVEYVRRPHAGPSATRNAGLALATQEFVAFLDADDVWMPDHLERKLARLAARDGRYSTSYDGYINIDVDGRPLWTMSSGDYDGPIDGRLMGSRYGLPAGMPYHLHRRAALTAVDGFDPNLTMGEDFDLLLRLERAGYWMTGSSQPTVWRRLRNGSLTTLDHQRTLLETERFLAKAEREDLLPAAAVAQMRKGLRLRLARGVLARNGNLATVAPLLDEAFTIEGPRGAGQWLLYLAARVRAPRAVLRLLATSRRKRGAPPRNR